MLHKDHARPLQNELEAKKARMATLNTRLDESYRDIEKSRQKVEPEARKIYAVTHSMSSTLWHQLRSEWSKASTSEDIHFNEKNQKINNILKRRMKRFRLYLKLETSCESEKQNYCRKEKKGNGKSGKRENKPNRS